MLKHILKYSTVILLLLIFINCKPFAKEKNNKPIDAIKKGLENNVQQLFSNNTPPEIDIEDHIKKYNELKKRILNYKKHHKNSVNTIVSKEMSKLLIDSIFPYWMGTKWDFNGYTETPLKGVVACGYFVSTTIRDVGIKINRFKTAQKGATAIINSLCDKKSVKRLSSIQKLETYMKTQNDYELIIVGLDFHIGFLFNKNSQTYFAHSNYIGAQGVVIEPILESEALLSSNSFVLGNFSTSSKMLLNWKN